MGSSNVVFGLTLFVFGFVVIFILCSITLSSMVNQGVFGLGEEFADYMEQEFINCFDFIGSNFINDMDEIGSWVENEFDYIESILEKTFETIIHDTDQFFDKIESETANFILTAVDQVEKCADYMDTLIDEGTQDMINYVDQATDIMLDSVEKFCTNMVNTIDNEFNYFIGYVDHAIDKALMSLYNDMVGWADWLGATLELFCKEAEDGLIYAGSELVKYGQKVWDSIESGTEKVINTITTGVDKVTKTVESWY